MFTWKYSESVELGASASASQVWAIWSDPTTWPVWDHELKWVKLDGEFANGTKGKMKPYKGPEVVFELICVNKNKSFVDRARLPLTQLDFDHFYEPGAAVGDKGHIKHSIEFRGFLAPVFGFLIGRNIKKSLRSSMLNLARRAEAAEQPNSI